MKRSLSPAEFYHSELEQLREIWETGNLVALFDAVKYCSTVKIALPEWAALGVLNTIQQFHLMAGTGKSGPHTSHKGRLSMDYAHYLRWRALKIALLRSGMTELPVKRGRPALGVVTATALVNEAKESLKAQKLARTTDEIKQSFMKVEASLANGEATYRFDHLFSTIG